MGLAVKPVVRHGTQNLFPFGKATFKLTELNSDQFKANVSALFVDTELQMMLIINSSRSTQLRLDPSTMVEKLAEEYAFKALPLQFYSLLFFFFTDSSVYS